MTQSFELEISNLEKLAVFREAGRDALNALAFNADAVLFNPGDVIFRQGEEAHDAWLILSGDARVVCRHNEGHTSAAPVSPGMLAGETALFEESMRRSTLTAESTLCALRITRSTFLRALGAYPDLAASVRRALSERLVVSAGAIRALL